MENAANRGSAERSPNETLIKLGFHGEFSPALA